MTINTQLRFINNSSDRGQSNIVFFQKNEASNEDKWIAWRVIRHCGYRNFFPITFTGKTEINLIDWNGNHSPRQLATPGDRFEIIPHAKGRRLRTAQSNNNPVAISVQNCLDKGALHVSLYRSGFLVAQQKNVIPGQQVKFALTHRLYVAVLPGIKEGDLIHRDMLLTSPTEFSLLGIGTADICMCGGGDETALRFELTAINAS